MLNHVGFVSYMGHRLCYMYPNRTSYNAKQLQAGPLLKIPSPVYIQFRRTYDFLNNAPRNFLCSLRQLSRCVVSNFEISYTWVKRFLQSVHRFCVGDVRSTSSNLRFSLVEIQVEVSIAMRIPAVPLRVKGHFAVDLYCK